MNAIKLTKMVTVAIFIVSMVGYQAFEPHEAPYLPLLTWPLAYLAIAYWIGRDSVREDYEFHCLPNEGRERSRHSAGLLYMRHGIAFGLMVAVVVGVIRAVGTYPLPRRWVSLVVAAASGYAMHLYARHVLKVEKTMNSIPVVLFGGAPIWSQFDLAGDD